MMHIKLWCPLIQGASFFPSAYFVCCCFAWQLFTFPHQPFPVPREQLWTSGIQLGVIYTGRWRMWFWHWINSKNDENLKKEKKSCVLFVALHTLVLLKRLSMYRWLIYDDFLLLRAIITKAKWPSSFFYYMGLIWHSLQSLQTNFRQHLCFLT